MKKILFSLLLMIPALNLLHGQSTDELISKCNQTAGTDAQYLKDFRIQLGSAAGDGELRYKAQMSLMKNMKYRFSMCNTDDSKGKLFINLKDDAKKLVLSSFDKKSGKSYSSIDFLCNKTGIYEVLFDFTDRQQGTGVGVISFVK